MIPLLFSALLATSSPLIESDLVAERVGIYEFPQLALDTVFGTGGDNTATLPWMALANIAGEFSDPGSRFVPTQRAINFQTSAVVHHVYTEKHDKSIVMIFWREGLRGDYEMLRRFAKRSQVTVTIPNYKIKNIFEIGSDGYLNQLKITSNVMLGPDAIIMEFIPS